jgi:hypothetical protein
MESHCRTSRKGTPEPVTHGTMTLFLWEAAKLDEDDGFKCNYSLIHLTFCLVNYMRTIKSKLKKNNVPLFECNQQKSLHCTPPR